MVSVELRVLFADKRLASHGIYLARFTCMYFEKPYLLRHNFKRGELRESRRAPITLRSKLKVPILLRPNKSIQI